MHAAPNPDPTPDRRSATRTGRLRVILADLDALVRRTVRDALEHEGVVVVAEASTGQDAVGLVLHYRPDVLVMDLMGPGEGGIEAARRLSREAPEVRLLVVTLAPDPDVGLLALRSGASGYVEKTGDVDRMPQLVRKVAAGAPAIAPVVAMRMIHRLRELPENGIGLRPVFSPLTRREWEVIDRLTAGDTAEQIADEFVLSPETIRTHIKNILRKLDVHSQAEAIAEAARMRGAIVPAVQDADGPPDAVVPADERAPRELGVLGPARPGAGRFRRQTRAAG